jgi:hypothetical protein
MTKDQPASPNGEPFAATNEQKAAAFEWLREHALSDLLGSWYAGVLLREITELQSAVSESATPKLPTDNPGYVCCGMWNPCRMPGCVPDRVMQLDTCPTCGGPRR